MELRLFKNAVSATFKKYNVTLFFILYNTNYIETNFNFLYNDNNFFITNQLNDTFCGLLSNL
jgi:hypothetical protein